MERERRSFPLTEIRIHEGDSGKSVEGHAAVFDKLSEDLGGFREKIERGAFDGVLTDDVRALFNHDANMVLGRTKSGTLTLETDNDGLVYRFSPPETSAGKDLLVMLERGDVDQSSFGFRVSDDKWEERDDGQVIRTIKKVERLFDVSPVTFPAYPDTDVAKREYRNFMESKETEKQEREGVEDEPSNGLRNKLLIRKLQHRKQAI